MQDSGNLPVARLAVIAALSLGIATVSTADDAPIIQPGAPGKPSKELTAEKAVEIADTSYSPADALFMQDMIPHHQQAIEMAALVADRTNRPEIVDAAGRIDASQADEIEFMKNWLLDRGERVPEPTHYHEMHTAHTMAGMATPEQMEQLAESESTDFDRLFLTLMITHHEGAVTMVEELLQEPGSAYDPLLLEFTSDIVNDQTAEIVRMHGVLMSLSDDPRADLAPGLYDAGEAILNLELVASFRKPPGFNDPNNPTEVRKGPVSDEEDDEDRVDLESDEQNKRSPMLSFSNTDMAFSGDVLVAGSYHGFNIYKLGENGVPDLITSVVCPGGQGDVSIVGDLLIMSVQETRSRLDCGLQGVSEDVSADRFRGIRIFDISDLQRPIQVGAVQTCRGSHTHSVISGPGENGKIVVYNSGTSSIREQEEMEVCFDELPGDARTALFRIDVIEIPVDDPASARIVNSPAVFADPETGSLAGLWRGGEHGDDTQETDPTDQCHDITAFPDKNIAAGACSGNGIIFDISDPLKPKRIDAVVDAGFAYWHSATFNNDGTKVLFTDEWGGGSMARCRAYDPLEWGANAIYDIVDGKLEFRSYFKIPVPQHEKENCVAHNGSIVPVPGRDIFVQAWYQGGVSLIDFTDSANPVEIAYFDRGPIDLENLILGGYWSTYWYGDKIYGTEITRGLDVLGLLPSEYMSESEIAAAGLANYGDAFNPQQQLKVTWPNEPVVAQAYVDQLERSGILPTAMVAALTEALQQSAAALENGATDPEMATRLNALADDLPVDMAPQIPALQNALGGVSSRLR